MWYVTPEWDKLMTISVSNSNYTTFGINAYDCCKIITQPQKSNSKYKSSLKTNLEIFDINDFRNTSRKTPFALLNLMREFQ